MFIDGGYHFLSNRGVMKKKILGSQLSEINKSLLGGYKFN